LPIGAREKKVQPQRIKERCGRGRNFSWFACTVHLTGIHLEIVCVFRAVHTAHAETGEAPIMVGCKDLVCGIINQLSFFGKLARRQPCCAFGCRHAGWAGQGRLLPSGNPGEVPVCPRGWPVNRGGRSRSWRNQLPAFRSRRRLITSAAGWTLPSSI
jgi:hypothetical protein